MKYENWHHTAIVESDAIDPSVVIGAYCVIEPDVTIRSGTVLESFVELRAGTKIGHNCRIDSGVVMTGDCAVEDDVTIRLRAIIGRNGYVGRGTFIGPHAGMINLDHLGVARGCARIGADCFIGEGAILHHGITIGDGAIIGALALVTHDVPPGETWVGIPARKHVR
jgi:acetyltransferase-like isoleucine patch superfamily enzyme